MARSPAGNAGGRYRFFKPFGRLWYLIRHTGWRPHIHGGSGDHRSTNDPNGQRRIRRSTSRVWGPSGIRAPVPAAPESGFLALRADGRGSIARRIAGEAGLDLRELAGKGSGPDGRIVKIDVAWKLEEYTATFGDDDLSFVGSLDPAQLPARAQPGR